MSDSPDDRRNVTQDFIFGDLSSGPTLVRALTAEGTGLWHGSRTVPPVPAPGQPVIVECSVGVDLSVRSLDILYTTDGSIPDSTSTAISMDRHRDDRRELNWT